MALNKTQIAVRRVLEQIYAPQHNSAKLEQQLVLDDQNGHYLLLHVGWNDFERTHGIVVHLDIKDDLVWVQRDNTNLNIVAALLEQGLAKNQIVLGFHAPFKRQFGEYATGLQQAYFVAN
jgi:hypothetical protein